MTSTEPTTGEPTPSPSTPTTTAGGIPTRPAGLAAAAFYDAVGVEYGVIYGYGHVSAHSLPELNELVSTSMAEHRERREAAITMMQFSGVTPPMPAAGYALPIAVENPDDAARLAVSMEEDAAVAWRAMLEQADDPEERTFAVTALTETAVRAARWNRVLGVFPVTVAFPGGSEDF
ncbi:MAG: ferritin-like domain-containing protein [Mycobacterium sp.]